MNSVNFLSPEQLLTLFPQLENIRLHSQKGPQLIYHATLKSNFAPVELRVLPLEQADSFGWGGKFRDHARMFVNQTVPGMLPLYDVGEADGFVFLIHGKPQYPAIAQLESLPTLQPLQALELVKKLTFGLQTVNGGMWGHGGLYAKTIFLEQNGQDIVSLPVNICPIEDPKIFHDFAAPEFVSGQATAFTATLDIYSLGVLLYTLLTGKTPMQANFVMPSALCSCNQEVDNLVATAIQPDPAKRYKNLGEFLSKLDAAIASSTVKSKRTVGNNPLLAARSRNDNIAKSPVVRPRAMAAASPFANVGKTDTENSDDSKPNTPIFNKTPQQISVKESGVGITFFLIPALIVAIVITYVCVQYKQDMAQMADQMTAEQNTKKKRLKEHVTQQNERAATTKVTSAPDSTSPIIETTELTEVATAEEISELEDSSELSHETGMTNWARHTATKVKQSSNRNGLDSFGPEKAVDGNTDSGSFSSSIAITDVIPGKPAGFGMDFGKDTNRMIAKIVLYTPSGTSAFNEGAEKLKLTLLGNSKNVLADKILTVSPTEQTTTQTTWVLKKPIPARALRIETTDDSKPLVLTEIAVYGPEGVSSDSNTDSSNETE